MVEPAIVPRYTGRRPTVERLEIVSGYTGVRAIFGRSTPIGNGSCGVSFDMPTTRHCVLIVDDEPDVCDSVHDLLRREFRVLKAHSAEEGYRIMQEEEVHIVMSDQRMPQDHGDRAADQAQGPASACDPDALHRLRRPGIDHRGDQPGAHLPVLEEALAAGGAAGGRAAGGARIR